MKEEQIPEKATKEQLIVGGQGHRTELDREQDVWFAVAELAKGRTYREIAQMISEKKGYHLAHQQVYKDIQEVLIEWKRENMQNIDAFIAREVARLEEIERRVLSDYEKSKLPRPNEYAALMKRGYSPEEIDEIRLAHAAPEENWGQARRKIVLSAVGTMLPNIRW